MAKKPKLHQAILGVTSFVSKFVFADSAVQNQQTEQGRAVRRSWDWSALPSCFLKEPE